MRHRPFFDGPERLAGYTIEHIEKSKLRRLCNDIDHLPVVLHSEKLRRSRRVIIPEIVMHQLVMPQTLARARIERQQTIAIEIRAQTIAAPEIICRRTDRKICDAALFVDGKLAPDIRPACGLVSVFRPCVVTEFARIRDRVKGPHEFAAHYVVSADIARRRAVAFAGG